MNNYEEELQKKIEAGQTAQGDDLDIKAYQQVFNVLKKEPEIKLSRNFSDQIISKVLQQRKRDTSRDMFWLGAGIFFIIIAFIVAVAMTGFKLDLGFLKDISAYSGLFVFGAALLVFINWLDKRIIIPKHRDF